MNKQDKTTGKLAEMLNDCSIDRILAFDKEWRIMAWNQTSEHITGLKKDEILNRRLLEVFPQLQHDSDLMDGINSAFNGHSSFIPSKPSAFNRHYYENHFIPLKDDEGEIFGVMNIMHDVAHRVKAELQLENLNIALAERNQQLEKANGELATFTRITGNELKEPIRKAYTSIETIAKNSGPNLPDTSKAALRRVQASLNRMNLLVDDILALATAGSFADEFTEVDLNLVFDEALEILREKINEKQARIEAPRLPVVPGSRQMLRYLFVNLLDNALKFQPEGNIPVVNISVELITGNTLPGGITGLEKKYICLHFTDNGIGFAQSDAARLFTMFERLHARNKYGGSGIGLTISQKIAEAHGGFIEAKGLPGHGAIFTCCLTAGSN